MYISKEFIFIKFGLIIDRGCKAPFFITQNSESIRYIGMHILTTSTDSQSIDVIPLKCIRCNIVVCKKRINKYIVTQYTSDQYWDTYEATFSGSEIEWQGSTLTYSEGQTYLTINNEYDSRRYILFFSGEDKLVSYLAYDVYINDRPKVRTHIKQNNITLPADNEFIVL